METRYRAPSLEALKHNHDNFALHEKIFWHPEENKPYNISFADLNHFKINVFNPLFKTNDPQIIIGGFLWWAESQPNKPQVQAYITQLLNISPTNPLSFRRVIIYYVALLKHLNTVSALGATKDNSFIEIPHVIKFICDHFYHVCYIHPAQQALESFRQIIPRIKAAKGEHEEKRSRVASTAAYLISFVHDRTINREHQTQFITIVSNLADNLLKKKAPYHIEAILKAIAFMLMYEIEKVEPTKTSTSFTYFELAKFVGFVNPEKNPPHTSDIPDAIRLNMCTLLENFFSSINEASWKENCPPIYYENFHKNYFLKFTAIIEEIRTEKHRPTSWKSVASATAWEYLGTLCYRATQVAIAYTAGQALTIGNIGTTLASRAANAAGQAIVEYGGAIISYFIKAPVTAVTHLAVEKGLHVGLVFGFNEILNRIISKNPEKFAPEVIIETPDGFNRFLLAAIALAPDGTEEKEFLQAMQELYNNHLPTTEKQKLLNFLPTCYTKDTEQKYTPVRMKELKPEEKTSAPAIPPPAPVRQEPSVDALIKARSITTSSTPATHLVQTEEPSAPEAEETDDLEPGSSYALVGSHKRMVMS